MQNGFVDRSRDLPSSQLDDLSESQSLEKSSLGRLGEPAILIAGKAHEARQALHDLHSTGYKFDQIVKKGLNPEILKGLYTESGILRTHSPSAQQQDQVIGSTAGGAPMTGTLDTVYIVKNVNRGQPQHSKEVSYIANASGNDKPLLRSKDTSNINSLISVTTTKDDKPPNTLPKSIKGVLGKIPGTKAGDSKVVDRKEYIARMLAAKAGKPASSAGASIIPKATTSTDADSVIQTITLPAPSTISSATLQQDVQPITEPKIDPSPQTAKEDLEVEANKKAQTDLARQKIDALRFRASKQQDARRAASDESNHQSKQPLSAPQTQGLFDIPLTASQPTLSSRQGSYFSPMSQKPPFSIPGLFMTSDTLESAKSSQQMESQVLGASQQRDNQAISRAVQQQFHSIAFNAPKLASRTTERSPLPGYNVDTGNSPLPSLRSSPTITHRKRQKAADFIDSPATRVKRPFGQQEHSSVIIDISEDDASSLEDNGLDMEIDDGRDSLPPQSHTGDTGNEKPKSFRDVPPLTEFPSQKKAADVIPPAIQALTQVKDLKGLKSKEMEIESMNRRIKELEERIMAKRTTSRAQTPGAFGSTTVSSPASQSSHKVSDQPSAITGVARPTDRSTSPTPAQHSSLAAVDNTESATEEQLVVEQRLQEAELAKAEAERSPAANVVRASEEHRRLQEEISQAPERDEQKQLRDQEQRQRQDELQHVRLHRAEQQRPREKSLQQAQEEGAIRAREADDRLPRQQQQTLEEEGQRRLQEEQRQLRKTEIESDLPILNATAERTREKLESLRGEIADLDKEFQKGVEDKKILMDELYRLSQTTATIEMPVEPTLPAFNVPRAEVVTRGESTQGKCSH